LKLIHTLSNDSEAIVHPVQEFVQFCDGVREHFDHDCWSITWLDTVREGRSLALRLAVDTGLNEQPNQIWEVGSHHARGFSLVEFELTDWILADDHVLLWDHQEAFSQLNFSAPCKKHDDVLWKLYERHRAVAWPWIPFERYINSAILENCLSTGSGVLADGPDRLLREYADVLKTCAIEPYFPYPARAAHRWDEEHRCWLDEQDKLSVLILGSSSYIVGTDFFASRIG
jgi:hypothetical protein